MKTLPSYQKLIINLVYHGGLGFNLFSVNTNKKQIDQNRLLFINIIFNWNMRYEEYKRISSNIFYNDNNEIIVYCREESLQNIFIVHFGCWVSNFFKYENLNTFIFKYHHRNNLDKIKPHIEILAKTLTPSVYTTSLVFLTEHYTPDGINNSDTANFLDYFDVSKFNYIDISQDVFLEKFGEKEFVDRFTVLRNIKFVTRQITTEMIEIAVNLDINYIEIETPYGEHLEEIVNRMCEPFRTEHDFVVNYNRVSFFNTIVTIEHYVFDELKPP
jgi:hypothetical protein